MINYEVVVSYAHRRRGDVFAVEPDHFSDYLVRQGYIRPVWNRNPDAPIVVDLAVPVPPDPDAGVVRKRRARKEPEVTDGPVEAVSGGDSPDSEG